LSGGTCPAGRMSYNRRNHETPVSVCFCISWTLQGLDSYNKINCCFFFRWRKTDLSQGDGRHQQDRIQRGCCEYFVGPNCASACRRKGSPVGLTPSYLPGILLVQLDGAATLLMWRPTDMPRASRSAIIRSRLKTLFPDWPCSVVDLSPAPCGNWACQRSVLVRRRTTRYEFVSSRRSSVANGQNAPYLLRRSTG